MEQIIAPPGVLRNYTKIKHTTKMTIDGRHITADEGKVFRRIGTEEIFGEEIFLGYSYYINGVLQNPPHYDVPEDFEEIDKPIDETQEEIIDE